jgi:hypothetical protein
MPNKVEFVEPKRISLLLKNYQGTWMIAGGWAIDLFLKTETRKHQDIEVAIPRNEIAELKSYLKDWNFSYIKNRVEIPWNNEEQLLLPIHEIQAIKDDKKIEILLNEIENNEWTYRRTPNIKYPLQKLCQVNDLGINFLAPEVVLLYKVKINKSKDIEDLFNTVPKLGMYELTWLIDSIKQEQKNSKEWLHQITNIQQTISGLKQ